MFGLGLGGALLALIGLLIWIVLLVWLSERILRFIGIRTAWGPIDPRNMLASFVLLTGAIHLGNYGLDLLDSAMREVGYDVPLAFPGTFLIGSVAIGVGIAGVRCWRRLKSGK